MTGVSAVKLRGVYPSRCCPKAEPLCLATGHPEAGLSCFITGAQSRKTNECLRAHERIKLKSN